MISANAIESNLPQKKTAMGDNGAGEIYNKQKQKSVRTYVSRIWNDEIQSTAEQLGRERFHLEFIEIEQILSKQASELSQRVKNVTYYTVK